MAEIGKTCFFPYLWFLSKQNPLFILKGLGEKARKKRKSFGKSLNKGNRKDIIDQLPDWHESVFEEIDCLECAACCKNYSPRFKPPDISRISKSLRMKEGDFIEKYLRMDEDGDYVVRSTPCPFLGADNHCSIYSERPSDCARFPYTDEDVFVDKPHISLKNSTFCPAAFAVLERIESLV